MKHLDLFSGIGGFALAARWMNWTTVQFVEIDSFCQKVLKKHWPNVPIHGDIKTFDGNPFRGTVDIITGGPPCQPASLAGKRKGENDDRWLWPEAFRIFAEVKPSIAVFENPDDLLSLDNGWSFERICLSMESMGYTIETFGIPAACVGAWHERDRIWIIAYTDRYRCHDKRILCNMESTDGVFYKSKESRKNKTEIVNNDSIDADIDTQGLQKSTCTVLTGIFEKNGSFKGSAPSRVYAEIGVNWETEPGVVRMVHGLPNRVDRIKSLGNAIVPQVAFEILKAIELIENERSHHQTQT